MDLQCNYMRARLIRIGNSRGVRLPKPLIEEAGLGTEVEISVRQGEVVIRPAAGARSGWDEAARKVRLERGEVLLEQETPTKFDREDWKW